MKHEYHWIICCCCCSSSCSCSYSSYSYSCSRSFDILCFNCSFTEWFLTGVPGQLVNLYFNLDWLLNSVLKETHPHLYQIVFFFRTETTDTCCIVSHLWEKTNNMPHKRKLAAIDWKTEQRPWSSLVARTAINHYQGLNINHHFES